MITGTILGAIRASQTPSQDITREPWSEGFESVVHRVDGTPAHDRVGGHAEAPVLVLLHGFPQTHLMWHRGVTAHALPACMP